MQAVLVMFRSDGERRSFSIARDMTVIGRREDCDLRIPLGDVSRKHCRLVRDGDILKIEDLGSSNGTYLNAQRVQEALLSPGDSIQVGPVVFVLQVDGEPADDELSPVTMEAPAESAGGTGAGVAAGAAAGGSMANDESGVLQPTRSAGGDDDGDELEELEPLEDPDALEPIGEDDGPGSGVAAAPAGGGGGGGGGIDDELEELGGLEPLDELDPLEPDLDLNEEPKRKG